MRTLESILDIDQTLTDRDIEQNVVQKFCSDHIRRLSNDSIPSWHIKIVPRGIWVDDSGSLRMNFENAPFGVFSFIENWRSRSRVDVFDLEKSIGGKTFFKNAYAGDGMFFHHTAYMENVKLYTNKNIVFDKDITFKNTGIEAREVYMTRRKALPDLSGCSFISTAKLVIRVMDPSMGGLDKYITYDKQYVDQSDIKRNDNPILKAAKMQELWDKKFIVKRSSTLLTKPLNLSKMLNCKHLPDTIHIKYQAKNYSLVFVKTHNDPICPAQTIDGYYVYANII